MPRRKAAQRGFPWYRKFNDTWYVTANNGQHALRGKDGRPIRGKDNEAAGPHPEPVRA